MRRAEEPGALWRETARERIAFAPLSERATADLAIIGGGFTGCAAALKAASEGARVRLLEARAIGYGGSGRNVGLVNAGLWAPPSVIAKTLGPAQGARLSNALAAAPDRVFALIDHHEIACDAVRAGTLHCAHSRSGLEDLRRRYADLATLGAPVSLLSGAEAEARTGSAAFHGALFDQRAGVIQPLAFVRGLARAAAAAGAALHEESAVLRIDRTPSALWRVETDRGAVEAPALLLATNAYHAEAAGAPAPIATPVFYFQLATKPLSDNLRRSVLPGGEGAWDTAPVMSSFRLDGAGRLLIGGVGALDGPAGGVHRAWASRQLSRLFPQLADQPLESAVCGRIAMSADKLPKLQRLGPRGYSVFGYSGRGIGPGVTFGEAAAAALLSGDETGLPLAPIDRAAPPSRFASGAAFEAGAAAIHLFGARSPI